MQNSEELTRQNSSYKCVIDEDDITLASPEYFELALRGDVLALQNISQNHPEHLSVRDDSGASLLHHATSGRSLDVIRFIVSVLGTDALNATDEQGRTPLHWAVEENQEDSCALLLELGADPNILDTSLNAPLHLAISRGHNHLVEVLVSCSKTDVNLEGDLGNTPVMLACSHNNCQALHILFKHGAKLCHQNKLGHFAIHAVAFAGAKEAMDVILKKGEEMGHAVETHINYLDKSKSSPLHLAVRGGNTEVIKLCISKGARVDQQQCDKSTALHFACTQGAMEAVKLMLSAYNRVEDIINIRDGASQTPLHKATLFDHVELAEYLVSKGADINCIDCKGLSPLLLATSCGAWACVTFLLSKGANFNIKDKSGRNFLHLATFQPKGLKNIPENILQSNAVRELFCDEDSEGCTPLHYACKLGIHDSVKNMLGLNICLNRKSKQKKSALHFAAEYGRINTCHRLLESIRDSKLLNEEDEKGLTPLHLASRGGHTKVVELLLRRGALFQSDYKGWTCLHHAAAEGYTQTMKILLAANVKLLDNTDEDGNTALHIAAREGHVAAVILLLDRGAEIILNKSDSSFVHDAVRNGKKDIANAVIDHERSEEALKRFRVGSPNRCVVLDLIEFLPESFRHLLDRCMKESEHDANSADYHIEYHFHWLQAPIQARKLAQNDKSWKFQPLIALNAMVQFNRIELLTHPVCQKYLETKWVAYGSKVHLLNLAIYLLGLLPLTFLIVNLRPTQINSTNGTSVTLKPVSFREQNYLISACMLMVLIMNIYAICKEVVQMTQQRLSYFFDTSNLSDWETAISSLVFVVPMFFNMSCRWQWEAGALAILFAWVNFLLYLQRFEHFGIYVVMFGEIIKTLVSIIVLFIFLLLAFGLSFHALMLHRSEFSSMSLSLAQTFVMTVGELNYQNNIFDAYENGLLAFPEITYCVFVLFVLLMPILLMNLMIGLAVGDIAEVQRNACLKRIAMQISLHTNLEEKLPYWFMKRVDKPCLTIYPNRKCSEGVWHFWKNREATVIRTRLVANSHQHSPLEHEIRKQKYRLKEMSSMLEKQHNLLKLIIQKMEITSEADEYDGPQEISRPCMSQKSKWIPLIQTYMSRK
ncbi:transient receptor potential cation channel subfamily A member 1b [Chanos chanos]|uniref:Transient receptor potential cation channel subfamily A member 1b n=1 Tax=Chanos chanos TaxID=29144 RepID=A0A6J2UWF7_CHACN|nr:transient receptor potential cation channel subfamily A member 1 [Chanos chanos]